MAKKTWKDHNGNEIPAQYVPTIDKQKDRVARRILKNAIDVNNRLTKLKDESLAACDELYESMLEEAQVTVRKNSRGGYSITSFDKEIKIEVSIQERVEFDDNITIAQEKINEYLKEKTKDTDHDLVQIVNLAFKTTKGQLDVKRVLSLFQLNIKHKLWNEAMDVLKKSITRNNSRRYMRVWEKNKNGDYQSIDLNFSSL